MLTQLLYQVNRQFTINSDMINGTRGVKMGQAARARRTQHVKIEHDTCTIRYKLCHVEDKARNGLCLARRKSIMGQA